MKTRAKGIIALLILLVVGMLVLVSRRQTASQEATTTATMDRVRQVNLSRPARQTQGKMLMMAAFGMKRIPEAADWCDTLNAGGSIWPVTPTNTVFALNASLAGRAFPQAVGGDTVVFFETAHPGWNQSGGAELLASDPEGVAVAFADGRTLMVTPAQAASLRWTP